MELQKLIASQYGLKGRLEKRDREALVLQPVKGGTKGFKPSSSEAPNQRSSLSPGLNRSYQGPLSLLVGNLRLRFEKPVIDQTGLVGDFDYALQWDDSGKGEAKLERLKQAMSEQLGLELVPTNIPIDMLVVEKAK